MDPGRGRFLGMDPFVGMRLDPLSLHRYAYAHLRPLNGRDPTGLMTLLEVQQSQSISNLLQEIKVTSSIQVRRAAFRRLGQLAEQRQRVGKIAEEVLEAVAEDILFDGVAGVFTDAASTTRFDNAQRRVIDFYAVAGDFVADIEVKYGIPRRGSDAMRRLISQARSMNRGPRSLRVLVIMSENVSDAAVERLRRSLRGGRAGPVQVLHGAEDVVQFFRGFFLGRS